MSAGENAQEWLEKGAEAFANMRTDEAVQHFARAVTADPYLAKAHLSLGAIYLFQYQNGIAWRPNLSEGPGESHKTVLRELDQARAETRRAQIAEQNATNATTSEKHLRRALELHPRYQLAMEYLAGLYFWWLDPATERRVRGDDAKQWYQRVLDINLQHPFANYACGVIDYENAMRMIRWNTGFPTPPADVKSQRSLRAKAGPLLEDSARNFLRALELEPDNTDAMTFLIFVRRDQLYIAEANDEAERFRAEANEWQNKLDGILAARAKAAGQPWPPSPSRTGRMTFRPIEQAGERAAPSFPPDARLLVPPAPPPLPIPRSR
jgi:tetratricopeptide (TPR) repeat protein